MSDKYCPAGQKECERYGNQNYSGDLHHHCRTYDDDVHLGIDGFEVCPWPSKQKKVKDKYEKAWELLLKEGYLAKIFRVYCRPKVDETISKAEFIQALKEAGL